MGGQLNPMEEDLQFQSLPITLYGTLTSYTSTISKCRARVFYRNGNRNHSYIGDDTAEQLLSTIPYAPIKGIFSQEDGDFEDHGKARTEGRIYGIVPANPNLAWEDHEDEDGIVRNYACVDVLLYTGLYSEASAIANKTLSMELFAKTLKGAWEVVNGEKYYVIKYAEFLGLQALGDDHTPCFEGAGFYSYQALKDAATGLEQSIQTTEQGGKIMQNMNFKLSDQAKHEWLFKLLNPLFNEEGNWTMEYAICEVYENYAVVYNYENGAYSRAYYTKSDSDDSVAISSIEKCYIVDVNQEEYDLLQKLQGVYTWAEIDSKLTEAQALQDKNSEYSIKVEELNAQITTLMTERDAANAKVEELTAEQNTLHSLNEELNAKNEALTTENQTLNEFKATTLNEKKTAVIDSYSAILSEEVLKGYRDNIGAYTDEELDMRLTYECKKHGANLFNTEEMPGIVKPVKPQGGICEILDKYQGKH